MYAKVYTRDYVVACCSPYQLLTRIDLTSFQLFPLLSRFLFVRCGGCVLVKSLLNIFLCFSFAERVSVCVSVWSPPGTRFIFSPQFRLWIFCRHIKL